MYTNALIHEKSPYLRQHAHNPVDWLPWGEVAFQKARTEDKPIFLSIGYSTCHWCHVMAHESFEDPAVAEALNRDFVPIKLDREERPDVDRVYMLFVQASTGSGGWPMSVWLTPELKPFFGGTYFPPASRFGRPGFRELLEHLANAWRNERERVLSSSENVLDQLRALTESGKPGVEPDSELFESAFWHLRRTFDARWGGFGSAPKFPRPVVFNYLAHYYARTKNEGALEMTVKTLAAMAAGGIHDHLGGGFHRYSVDERWFVPHFEKMLYDQAQLVVAYAEAFQVTGNECFAEIARGIVSYVLRDMADAGGAFYSAEDADSPDPDALSHSREGAFYVWTRKEIAQILGEDADLFCARYGVQEEGNVEQDPQHEFVGRNILYEAMSEEEAAQRAAVAPESAHSILARSRARLFEARAKRPRPHLDRKILTAWNGLMISALARASWSLNQPEYLQAAERAASFLLDHVYDAKSGNLLRRFCDGEPAIPGFLDDYASFATALLDLFEAAFSPRYLGLAAALADHMLELFEDREQGSFFGSGEDSSDLVLRMKDDYDGAEPSGNSLATELLFRLADVTGKQRFRSAAERSLRAFVPKIKAQPLMAPQMLVALGRSLDEPEQIVIRCGQIGDQVKQILRERHSRFAPNSVIIAIPDELAAELAPLAPPLARLERKGRITIYECRNFTCELPKILD